MIERKTNGHFKKGSKPIAGFNTRDMKGAKHPMWKGGLPRCEKCMVMLKNRKAKRCILHRKYSKEGMRRLKAGALKRKEVNHGQWKGNKAGYRAKHNWVVKRLGQPTTCEHCGKTGLKSHKIHWANKSRHYKRIISDWIRLCPRCHKAFDKAKI